jgi:hypothetical protein
MHWVDIFIVTTYFAEPKFTCNYEHIYYIRCTLKVSSVLVEAICYLKYSGIYIHFANLPLIFSTHILPHLFIHISRHSHLIIAIHNVGADAPQLPLY